MVRENQNVVKCDEEHAEQLQWCVCMLVIRAASWDERDVDELYNI